MIGRTRWRFSSVDSTQYVAFQLAASGADNGTVVRADYQSAGRGRLGRTWEAPSNSALMFSLLLRPTAQPHELGSLAIQIGSVLCATFAELGVDNVSLKWPNDVLISGRKVSGILVQTRMMPNLVAVVGIGINVSASPPGATHLSEVGGGDINPEHVLDSVLSGLDQTWTSWQPKLSTHQIAEIDSRLWLSDEEVEIRDADRSITGFIAGVSADGGLRLITDGTEQIIRVGEITRGPRPLRQSQQH